MDHFGAGFQLESDGPGHAAFWVCSIWGKVIQTLLSPTVPGFDTS